MNQPLMPMFLASFTPCAYRRAGIASFWVTVRRPANQGHTGAASQHLSSALPFGVALAAFPKYITDRVDWDSGAAVLTDQYAPANLLNRP